MKNEIVNTIKTDNDFLNFMQRFKKKIKDYSFSDEYKKHHLPEERKIDFPNSELQYITERGLIRDNIFIEFDFDIFEFPIVVFYQTANSKEMLKGFKLIDDATKFSANLLQKDIYSILILIMNRKIEYRIFN